MDDDNADTAADLPFYYDAYQNGYRRGLRKGKRNGLTAAFGWELLFGAVCLFIGFMCGRGLL